jgi:hypothetical protein
MRLLSFILIFLFFFYLIPLGIGYILGRNWGPAGPRWGGWTVTGFYAGWMLLTWFQEGYSPVPLTRLVSLESTVTEIEIYSFITHMVLILITLFAVYSGAGLGTRMGYAKLIKKERHYIGPPL